MAADVEQYRDSNGNLIDYELVPGGFLGGGSFGHCFQAREINDSSKEFAIKMIDVVFFPDQFKEALLEKQFRFLKDGNLRLFLALKDVNRHVIRYFGVHPRPPRLPRDGLGHIVIAMEYANSGDLQKFIQVHKPLAKDTILCFTKQIIQGLDYLHKNGIVHGDLKPGNIVLHRESPKPDSEVVKICDWDNAAKIKDTRTSRSDVQKLFGTGVYMSPEMMIWKAMPETSETYPGRPTDLWSLGCVVLFMIGQLLPPRFKTRSNEFVFDNVRHPLLKEGIVLVQDKDIRKMKELITLGGSVELVFEEDENAYLKSLVTRCCILQPKERPTPEMLLLSPFLEYTGYGLAKHYPHIPQVNVISPYNFGSLPKPDLWIVNRCSGSLNFIDIYSKIDCMEMFGDQYHAELEMICLNFEELKELTPMRLTVSSLQSIKLFNISTSNIFALVFTRVNGWSSDCLNGIDLGNVSVLSFVNCQDVMLRKGHKRSFRQLRIISFVHTSISHLEEDIFAEMPNLEYFGLLQQCNQCPISTSNVDRLMTDPEYKWFQKLVETRPSLFGSPVISALIATETKSLPIFQMEKFNRNEIVSALEEEPTVTLGGGSSFVLLSDDGFFQVIIGSGSPWLISLTAPFSTEGEQLVRTRLGKFMALEKDHPLEVIVFLESKPLNKQLIDILNLIAKHVISLHLVGFQEEFVLHEQIGSLDLANLLEITFDGCGNLILGEECRTKFPMLRALRFVRCKIPDIAEEILNDMHAFEFREMVESRGPESVIRKEHIVRSLLSLQIRAPLRSMCNGEIWRFKTNGFCYQSKPCCSDKESIEQIVSR